MPEGGSTNRGEGSESPRDLERSPSREAAWEDTDEERSLDEGQIRAALEAAPEGDNRMASPEVPLAQGIRVVEAGPLFLTRAEGQVIERRLQEEWRERNPGWETLPEDAMELRMHMDNAPMLEDVRTRVMLGEARDHYGGQRPSVAPASTGVAKPPGSSVSTPGGKKPANSKAPSGSTPIGTPRSRRGVKVPYSPEELSKMSGGSASRGGVRKVSRPDERGPKAASIAAGVLPSVAAVEKFVKGHVAHKDSRRFHAALRSYPPCKLCPEGSCVAGSRNEHRCGPCARKRKACTNTLRLKAFVIAGLSSQSVQQIWDLMVANDMVRDEGDLGPGEYLPYDDVVVSDTEDEEGMDLEGDDEEEEEASVKRVSARKRKAEEVLLETPTKKISVRLPPRVVPPAVDHGTALDAELDEAHGGFGASAVDSDAMDVDVADPPAVATASSLASKEQTPTGVQRSPPLEWPDLGSAFYGNVDPMSHSFQVLHPDGRRDLPSQRQLFRHDTRLDVTIDEHGILPKWLSYQDPVTKRWYYVATPRQQVSLACHLFRRAVAAEELLENVMEAQAEEESDLRARVEQLERRLAREKKYTAELQRRDTAAQRNLATYSGFHNTILDDARVEARRALSRLLRTGMTVWEHERIRRTVARSGIRISDFDAEDPALMAYQDAKHDLHNAFRDDPTPLYKQLAMPAGVKLDRIDEVRREDDSESETEEDARKRKAKGKARATEPLFLPVNNDDELLDEVEDVRAREGAEAAEEFRSLRLSSAASRRLVQEEGLRLAQSAGQSSRSERFGPASMLSQASRGIAQPEVVDVVDENSLVEVAEIEKGKAKVRVNVKEANEGKGKGKAKEKDGKGSSGKSK